MLLKAYNNNLDELLNANAEQLSEIDGIGHVIADSFVNYFADEKKAEEAKKLLLELKIQNDTDTTEQIFEYMNFVVTGSVENFR